MAWHTAGRSAPFGVTPSHPMEYLKGSLRSGMFTGDVHFHLHLGAGAKHSIRLVAFVKRLMAHCVMEITPASIAQW